MIDSERIMECVPNFSEGRRPEVIEAIAAAIDGFTIVKELYVPGKLVNIVVRK